MDLSEELVIIESEVPSATEVEVVRGVNEKEVVLVEVKVAVEKDIFQAIDDNFLNRPVVAGYQGEVSHESRMILLHSFGIRRPFFAFPPHSTTAFESGPSSSTNAKPEAPATPPAFQPKKSVADMAEAKDYELFQEAKDYELFQEAKPLACSIDDRMAASQGTVSADAQLDYLKYMALLGEVIDLLGCDGDSDTGKNDDGLSPNPIEAVEGDVDPGNGGVNVPFPQYMDELAVL